MACWPVGFFGEFLGSGRLIVVGVQVVDYIWATPPASSRCLYLEMTPCMLWADIERSLISGLRESPSF